MIAEKSQLTNSLLVWDRPERPPTFDGTVVLWRSSNKEDNIVSLTEYLECNAEELRKKYLGFIYDLGKRNIQGKSVLEHMDIGHGFSFWWMTSLAEKSPFKSPIIYECLMILALEKLSLELNPITIDYAGSNKQVRSVISEMCEHLKIRFSSEVTRPIRDKFSFKKIVKPFYVFSLMCLGMLRFLVDLIRAMSVTRPQWFKGTNSALLI